MLNSKKSLIAATISLQLLSCTGLYASKSMVSSAEDNAGSLPGARLVAVYKSDKGEAEIARTDGAVMLFDLAEGPANPRIKLAGNKIAPNKDGDYLGYPVGSPEFDAISCFGICNEVLDMNISDITTLSKQFPTSVPLMVAATRIQGTGRAPLKINIRAGTDANAFYTTYMDKGSEVRELKFFNFNPKMYNPKAKSSLVYTEQSPEVVAHETGHAILDLIKPEYFRTSSPQVGALHEAFGDLMAIFQSLYQNDIAEKAILATKGGLHKASFLNNVAEEFGLALGYKDGLRNVDLNIDSATAGDEVHDLSEVFSGAVYDILASAFPAYYMVVKGNPTDALRNVTSYLRQMLLHALIENDLLEPTFGNIAHSLLNVASQRSTSTFGEIAALNWSELINRQFAKRGVVPAPGAHDNDIRLNKIGKAVGICQTSPHAACLAAVEDIAASLSSSSYDDYSDSAE